ncbi:hypothetical protein IH785_10595 [candidate division KSB1 bacterium]|nr:hypothetical protein [candidate division KSB1 bacterium]
MKFSLSGIAVLFIYAISLVLAPCFHKHPGKYHADSNADSYHSHTDPFGSHSSEHGDEDHRKDSTPGHFSEPVTAADEMVGVSQAPGKIFNPTKFPPILVLFIQTSAESCSNQLSWQDAFTLLPLQPQQDYCILTAANLSPPQA